MEKKIAIVCSGGGMKCAYSAGALKALGESVGFKNPDIIIASSGSAGSLVYYLSGQYKSIEKIWTELLSTPKFISFFRMWKIMDIDYLIDEVFKKQEPLNLGDFNKTKVEYLITLTQKESRKGCYFPEIKVNDIFEVLRATKAFPFVFGKTVKINETNYIDGATSISFGDSLIKASQLGATHVIAISNSFYGFNDDYKKLKLVEDVGVKVVLLKDTSSRFNVLNRNPKKLREIFDSGFNDVVNSREVASLFI